LTDMRKRYRDFTTSRRIPGPHKQNTAVSADLFDVLYHQMTRDELGRIVAQDLAPLRAIEAYFSDRHVPECVINNGSSIIGMAKKIWEDIRAPVRLDLIMRMESSHGIVKKTIGVLKNFPITIGGQTFFVQIQVCENLPCDVLLGRPFFMCASATTRDYPDGSQDLILTNPNSREEITVPTKERTRKVKAGKDFY
jgi:hypothetical protein